MAEPLVFDTSAILNFGHRGELDVLLGELGRQHALCITAEARGELTDPDLEEYYREFVNRRCRLVRASANYQPSASLAAELLRLGLGEAATLLYCEATTGTIAVLDERAGRLAAQRVGINLMGTLGLLEECRRQGWITMSGCLAAVRRIRRKGGRFLPPGRSESWNDYLARYA